MKAREMFSNVVGATSVERNQRSKGLLIALLIVLCVASIAFVYSLAQKAQQTIEVCRLTQNVYKNQVIDESMLESYSMLQAEYEKYSIENQDGKLVRRVVLWDERGKIINAFAGYPLRAGTYVEYRTLLKSRVDNSDTVLYSFPGKEVIPLAVGAEDLQAFKSYLQPCDRLNIEAIYSFEQSVKVDDGNGNLINEKIEVFKTETVFKDILVADLLNSNGDSILDIYASYNEKSVHEQAQLDLSESFKEATEPKSLLVALTPEEVERYHFFRSKSKVEFAISMPQRTE